MGIKGERNLRMEGIALAVEIFGTLVQEKFLSLVGLGSGRKDAIKIGRCTFWLCMCHWYF